VTPKRPESEGGFHLFDTPIGPCGVAWTAKGISRIQLPEANPSETLVRIASRAAPLLPADPPAPVRRAIAAIVAHLSGRASRSEEIRLDLENEPPFSRKVYEEARRIPAGGTVTYGELAARIGTPGAARAVGQALGRNPVPIVVPCHRILAAGNRPGGFSAFGGLVTKERLLALEGCGVLGRSESGLPFDLDRARRELVAAEPRFAELVARSRPMTLDLPRRLDLFHALLESIVYQQLHGKAAATILARVHALAPRGKMTAVALGAISDEALRGAGLSRGKLAAARDLAAKALAGELPAPRELARMSDDEIVERLTAIRGIGRWTVEMLLIFGLGRPDVLPVADFGVRKGFARLFRKEEFPKPDELARRGERWRPWRSVASWYLWRLSEEGK
jgi:methylated-DNA-[protein]-cysteine S-methyltransferase